MPLIMAHRALLAGGLVLFGVGLDRLLNAWMLQGASASVLTRLVIGVLLIGAGGLLVGVVIITAGRRRRQERSGIFRVK